MFFPFISLSKPPLPDLRNGAGANNAGSRECEFFAFFLFHSDLGRQPVLDHPPGLSPCTPPLLATPKSKFCCLAVPVCAPFNCVILGRISCSFGAVFTKLGLFLLKKSVPSGLFFGLPPERVFFCSLFSPCPFLSLPLPSFLILRLVGAHSIQGRFVPQSIPAPCTYRSHRPPTQSFCFFFFQFQASSRSVFPQRPLPHSSLL